MSLVCPGVAFAVITNNSVAEYVPEVLAEFVPVALPVVVNVGEELSSVPPNNPLLVSM